MFDIRDAAEYPGRLGGKKISFTKDADFLETEARELANRRLAIAGRLLNPYQSVVGVRKPPPVASDDRALPS